MLIIKGIAMTSMNISLPDSMKAFVDTRVETGGYGSSSEYVRDLIRSDQIAKAREQLLEKLMEGLNSEVAVVLTKENRDEYWAKKRAALEAKYGDSA